MGGVWLVRAVPLACLAVAAALSAAVYFDLYLPERVYLSAFTCFPAAALTLAGGPRRWLDVGTARRGLALAALALLVVALIQRTAADLRDDDASRAGQAQAPEMIAALAPRPDQLYVLWASNFPYEQVVVPHAARPFPPELKTITFSWALRTPVTQSRLDAFGITDIYRAVYERDVRLICVPQHIAILTEYLKERLRHHGEGRGRVLASSLGRVARVSHDPGDGMTVTA